MTLIRSMLRGLARRSFQPIIIAAVTLAFQTSAWPQSGLLTPTDEARMYQILPFGYVDAAAVWPFYAIQVCWREDYDNWSREKKLSEDAVRDLIVVAAKSGYRFDGWSVCAGDRQPRIEVIVDLSRPNSLVGRQRTQTAFGRREASTLVHLNFADYCPADEFRNNCLKIVAVHEFLHALGFLHEHLRDEARRLNPTCVEGNSADMQKDTTGVRPLKVTDYDDDSIMNYCVFPNRYRQPARLSPRDVESIEKISYVTRMKIQGQVRD